MTLGMTREDARAYASRWQMVEAAELAELCATTEQQKFEQLASLMASARSLDWRTTDPAEVEDVRARWLLLVQRHGG